VGAISVPQPASNSAVSNKHKIRIFTTLPLSFLKVYHTPTEKPRGSIKKETARRLPRG
jgi:hypothetical protein